MRSLPQPLVPLADYKQFILWTIIERDGANVKIPLNYNTLKAGDAHDPAIWTDATTAFSIANLCGDQYHVGFVFTKNDPFFFIDIDHCLQPDNTWSPIANDLMARFNGAAVEISQSGSGLHIFGMGNPGIESDLRRKKAVDPNTGNKDNLFDLYTDKRFVALTGASVLGDISTDHTNQLNIITEYWLKQNNNNSGITGWTNKPVPQWNGYADDNELIEKALNTKSAASTFGGKATFADLWNNNLDILTECYLDDQGLGVLDDSKADAALAQHLAFWTGNDCDRILRLMWLSKLVRDKWKREDYLVRTITRAVSMQTIVYTAGGDAEPVLKLKGTPKQIEYANQIIAGYNDDRILSLKGPINNASFWITNKDKTIDEIIRTLTPIESAVSPLGTMGTNEILEGYQFLGVTQQEEHFNGCVYIQEVHRIFTPTGALLRSEQFNATYGGYVFQLDATGNGKTTRKAWDAFTESQLIRYPKAEAMTFRPDIEPGALIEDDGRVMVNTYIPINTPRMEGDATPFLIHLAKIIPDERDRSILLAYMAACIQYKGVKFQWCPVIQGTEGNGKTLFTRCVAFAIGNKYSHMPKAADIDNKFNGWMIGKLFIGIEDIYVPDHKREVIEALKPMITNELLEIQFKGVDQITARVCANFILNCNPKDGMRKTRNDRRFAIFYTAQQSSDDIQRDGMAGDYFPKLYAWLKTGGYAIVAQYLETYSIPNELNPASACHRAPETTSTAEAIISSMGAIEQEIIEAIDEGRPGFAGGWVSSIALERLLQALRATRMIPHNKRRDLLRSLGYDWHPALRDGRVNNFVQFDGGKPKLFIKNGHISSNLTTAPDVVDAYLKAQMGSGTNGSTAYAEKVFSKV